MRRDADGRPVMVLRDPDAPTGGYEISRDLWAFPPGAPTPFDASEVLLSVFVPGLPVPQGSMKAFHRPGMKFAVITSDNPKTKPWRADVKAAALATRTGYSEVGKAVAIACTFLMPRCKGDFGAKGLKASAPTHHTKKPDSDKLVRAILDALTGIVFADDSQVVSVQAWKRYALAGEVPGAHLLVTVEGA